MYRLRAVAASVLTVWLAMLPGVLPQTPGEAALLQIRILEGEAVPQLAGSRSVKPLVVLVTDELGRPVAGAAVSFRLPDTGASGWFADGMRSFLVTTGADGRATASGIRWDTAEGRVDVQITAAKDKVRAGTVLSLYLAAAPRSRVSGRGGTARRSGSNGKWVVVGLMLAGAAGAGFAAGLSQRNGSPAASPAPVPPQIGAPTITIGRP